MAALTASWRAEAAPSPWRGRGRRNLTVGGAGGRRSDRSGGGAALREKTDGAGVTLRGERRG